MIQIPLDTLQLTPETEKILIGRNIDTIEKLLLASKEEDFWDMIPDAQCQSEVRKILEYFSGGALKIQELEEEYEASYRQMIFTKEDLAELSAYSIRELDLSIRIHNILSKAGLTTMDKVAVLTEKKIGRLNGSGAKTQKEVLTKTKEWLYINGFIPTLPGTMVFEVVSDKERAYFEKIASMLSPLGSTFSWRELYCFTKRADLMERVESGGLEEVNEDNVISIFELCEASYVLRRLFKEIAPKGFIEELELGDVLRRRKLSFDEDIIVRQMKKSPVFLYRDACYYLPRKTFAEYMEENCSDDTQRDNHILRMRISGMGLQEIGDAIGVTRERIRQIYIKKVSSFPLLFEDYLEEPFEYFQFSKEEFVRAFRAVSPEGYEYLHIRHKRGKVIFSAQTLENYEGSHKERLRSYLREEAIRQDKLSVSRTEMVYRLLLSNVDSPIPFDEIETRYYAFLEEKGYPKDRLAINMRTISNFLRGTKHIVFDKNNCVRYCDADLDVLWNDIDFYAYRNLVISSDKIWRDYEDLMKELDIRDGYELFCLIKTSLEYWDASKFAINCRRIPVIVFGEGDEAEQAIALLREISPVSYWDYFAAYEERFGLRRDSALGNAVITSAVAPYNTNGKYVIDAPEIDERDRDAFKAALSKRSIWYIDDLEKLFDEICVHSGPESLNTSAFAKIGYALKTGCAYPDSYVTVARYLDKEVFSESCVDLAKLDRRMVALPTFRSVMDQRRKTLAYIEVSPKVLWSADKVLKEYDLSRDEIRMLQNQLRPFYEQRYFNAHSLWEEIREMPLVQKLKGNEWMCTCIMRQQENIFSFNIASNIILSSDSDALNLCRICAWITKNEGRMKLQDLTARFNELFGTTISCVKIAKGLASRGVWEQIVTDTPENYVSI